MKRIELTVERQACLVPSPDYPHVLAYVPTATPRTFSGSGIRHTFERTYEALDRFRTAMNTLPDAIPRVLARREAVESSHIEGMAAGIAEVFEYGCTHDGKDLHPDVSTTYNHVIALEYGLSAICTGDGRRALTLDLVKDMHKILMTNTAYQDPPGEFRSRQNWIGAGRIEDAIFVPPPAAEVASCMAELQASMLDYQPREDEHLQISIVAQLAIAHAQFQTIHPFRDGNGRIGRILIPLMLVGEDYPPLYLSGYLHRYQREYFEALQGVQLRGDWGRWMDFFSAAVKASADESVALVKELMDIRDRWQAALKDLQADATTYLLPEYFLGRPTTTTEEVSELLGVTLPVAHTALQDLVERQLVQERAGGKGRVFVASEILERLKRT